MKTRAAVAFEAKKPLEIVELDLEGPKAGEVLVEILGRALLRALQPKEFSPRSSAMRAPASSGKWVRASPRSSPATM